ncbi:hypothetical protein QVD17_24937 [Tagetes erecta]|uniref:VQ domain-containing protein n=1 Tax=Tagetes erecta TaxID=13708 RepID=A0AAD8KFK3_TARER|nr:hypothetical protein QVD17_24937 [Tagetes erecta]
MGQITNSGSSSTTSCSSSSSSKHSLRKTIKSTRKSHTNSLHSVQKPITKQFIAPLPPTPQKVYKVKSSNFKQLVHMLTTSPEFQSPPIRRLKDIAPPPLTLSTIPKPHVFSPPMPSTLSPNVSTLLNETPDTNRFVSNSHVMDYFGSLSPLGLKLSPAPPSSFDQSRVAVMSPLGLKQSTII